MQSMYKRSPYTRLSTAKVNNNLAAKLWCNLLDVQVAVFHLPASMQTQARHSFTHDILKCAAHREKFDFGKHVDGWVVGVVSDVRSELRLLASLALIFTFLTTNYLCNQNKSTYNRWQHQFERPRCALAAYVFICVCELFSVRFPPNAYWQLCL